MFLSGEPVGGYRSLRVGNLETTMQENLFPIRADDQHRMMERLASARISDDRAREIIQSPDASRAFLAEVAAGLSGYARRSVAPRA